MGTNEIWKLIVVEFISSSSRMRKPGLELVAFPRATGLEDLAIVDESEITFDMIMKSGIGNPYNKCHKFEIKLHALSATTQSPIMAKVAAYHPSTTHIFDGGVQALLEWRHEIIASHSLP
jgi:hypothetical protein